MSTTTYTVVIANANVFSTDDLSVAIREWNQRTHLDAAPAGGVMVRTVEADGTVTREGSILHVTSQGRVYLNPHLAAA